MSTRRPRVPRAAAPARANAPGTSGGGQVLRPDFRRHEAAGQRAPAAAETPPDMPRKTRLEAQPETHLEAHQETQVPTPVISRAGGPAAKPGPGTAGPGTAGSGPAAKPGPGTAVPVPARAFSGRLLALAVVLLAVTLFLAPSVRTYLQQQAEISQLQADISEQRQRQAELRNQLARWDDPSYIRQQARDRLFLVMPGERRYLVIGAESAAASKPPATSAEAARTDLPWVDALWDSVKRSATD